MLKSSGGRTAALSDVILGNRATEKEIGSLLVVGFSAALWVIADYINGEILFSWPAEERYRHWIFTPAGVKLLLLMIFGWSGALGVTAGILTNVSQSLPMLGVAKLAVIGAALGFMPLVAVWVLAAGPD